MTPAPFVKGHGTGNDFVLLPDHDASRYGQRVEETLVRAVCDRRRGIGADGVIRVVRAEAVGQAADGDDAWFMDYYNADGSVAEMCGNGVRVLARHLLEEGLVPQPTTRPVVATRAGTVRLEVHDDGDMTVDMGPARPGLSGSDVGMVHRDEIRAGTAVALPNPHAVFPMPRLAAIGPLHSPPHLHPAELFPEGANVEFVVQDGTHLDMRVWERGVGETLSCGTGVCAAAWVAMRADHAEPGTVYTVDVPGGRLWVTQDEQGSLFLRGPAVLVARGTFHPTALLC
jgi:diaminopimelate epimerase